MVGEKFTQSACFNVEKFLKRNIEVINEMLIDNCTDNDIVETLYNFDLQVGEGTIHEPSPDHPGNIFFIWIGEIEDKHLEYIDFWMHSNPEERVEIWFDSGFLLAGLVRTTLLQLFFLDQKKTKEYLAVQNDFYESICELISNGLTFDRAFINYVGNYCREKEKQLLNKIDEINSKMNVYSRYFSFVDISDHYEDIFHNPRLKEYYYIEVILRNNLAAASDILRLCILYSKGGLYIDVDTLPNISHIFNAQNYLHDCLRNESVLIEVVKTQKLLMKLRKQKILYEVKDKEYLIEFARDHDRLLRKLTESDEELVLSIDHALSELTVGDVFTARIRRSFHRDSLLISSTLVDGGCFASNLIIAHAGSRSIKIVISEMLKRYRYLRANGYIFTDTIYPENNSDYLGRLHAYRLDTIDSRSNVTLFLSGPDLILEVMVALSLKFSGIGGDLFLRSIVLALIQPNSGIGYTDQTIFTHLHLSSSWMGLHLLPLCSNTD